MLLTLALGVAFAAATAPTVTMEGASEVSYTSAHVSGTVDPQDQETTYYFQYSADPENEGWNFVNFQGPIAAGAGPQNVSDDLTGLRPGTKYFSRLIAENSDGLSESTEPNPFFTTETVAPPVVSIDSVTSVTGTTAHFSGVINPGAPVGNPSAFDVDWHFECTPGCPDLEGGKISADSSDHSVSANTSGLNPNTSYEVRLIASNAGGSLSAGPAAFKTDPVAPVVRTLHAGVIQADSVILAAKINPRNSSTTYQFEWGVDESYGNVVPAIPQELGVTDDEFHIATASLTGLQPDTTYRFRVVATNSESLDITQGLGHSFRTLASAPILSAGLPDGRVFEKVSPAEKAGGDVENDSTENAIARASIAGDAVSYFSLANSDGSSGAFYSQYLSRRTGNPGWSSQGINPVMDASPALLARPSYELFSEDLSKAVLGTWLEDRPWGLYLRDNIDGSLDWISKPDDDVPPLDSNTGGIFNLIAAAATPDLNHVVFESNRQLTLEAQDDRRNIYDWTNDELRLVSILPDGTVANGTATYVGGYPTSGSQFKYPGDYAVSEDGSRIFFSDGGLDGGIPELYVREDNATTKRLGVPECNDPECPSTETRSRAVFQAASADGSIAYFVSETQLTTDSSASLAKPDLYRWDGDAQIGHRLTNLTAGDPSGGGVSAVIGSAKSGSSVYFVASGDLAPGAEPGRPNIFRWNEQEGLRHIAAIDGGDESVWTSQRYEGSFRDARVTPDGRRLLFVSRARLTGYATAGTKQVYLYDAPTERVACVSCSHFSVTSSADSTLLSHTPIRDLDGRPLKQSQSSPYLPRNMSSDGRRVFFDTRQPLLPSDSNGKTDVYEWVEGKLHLISTGQSDDESYFVDASPTGDDVFFTTRESLVLSDRDAIADMYDARVGGSPEPRSLIPCIGDECQGTPTPAPSFDGPGSASLSGPGNPHIGAVKNRRCRKGLRKSRSGNKVRCIRKGVRGKGRKHG